MVFNYYFNSTHWGKTFSISHHVLHPDIQKYMIENDCYQSYYLIKDSGDILSIYLYCGDRIDVNYQNTKAHEIKHTSNSDTTSNRS